MYLHLHLLSFIALAVAADQRATKHYKLDIHDMAQQPGSEDVQWGDSEYGWEEDENYLKSDGVGNETPRGSDDLKWILSRLRAQLKETHHTQKYTRSILHVIHEHQLAQEEGLALLKQEIFQIQQERVRERTIITHLAIAVQDNGWAFGNLQSAYQRLHNDTQHLKNDVAAFNDSLTHVTSRINDFNYQKKEAYSFHKAMREELQELQKVVWKGKKGKDSVEGVDADRHRVDTDRHRVDTHVVAKDQD